MRRSIADPQVAGGMTFHASRATRLVDPFGGNQCLSIAPLFNLVHTRNAAPDGLGCVIEDDNLELARRGSYCFRYGGENLTDSFLVFIAPFRLRSGLGIFSVNKALGGNKPDWAGRTR